MAGTELLHSDGSWAVGEGSWRKVDAENMEKVGCGMQRCGEPRGTGLEVRVGGMSWFRETPGVRGAEYETAKTTWLGAEDGGMDMEHTPCGVYIRDKATFKAP